MAIKDFEMNIKNADGSYDILHPITKAKNVLFSDGSSVEKKLSVEQGIWAPKLEGLDVAGNHSYRRQAGIYHRIGNIVTIEFGVELSSKDSNMRGAAVIKGIPFVPAAMSGATEYAVTFSRIGGVGGGLQVSTNGYGTTSSIALQHFYDRKIGAVPATEILNNFFVYGTGTYIIK